MKFDRFRAWRRLVSALLYTKWSRTRASRDLAADSTCWSAAQRLPPELVEDICRFLVSSYLNEQFPFPKDECALQRFRHATAGQFALSCALSSCRSWYRGGIPVLYLYPVLSSSRVIKLFSRTLAKTRDLSALVQHVVIMVYLPSDSGTSVSLKTKQEFQRALDSLSVLLPSISPLSSLIIFNYHRSTQATTVLTGTSASTLRTLVIDGGPFLVDDAPPSPLLTLPNLVTLSLHTVSFTAEYSFPSLPQLKTLQIVDCMVLGHGRALTIPSVSLPALTCLELYDNFSYVHIEEACLQKLETFHHVGSHPEYVKCWTHCHTLRHLAFIHDADWVLPADIWLPPSLNSLTLCITLPGIHAHPQLRSNMIAIVRSGRVKTVTILFSKNSFSQAKIRFLKETSSLLRDADGIICDIADYSFETWVSERLGIAVKT
ncbi:unnamed protein product [Somion occarium]|uniref:F-box domain-containing protein n=1 Tax=Somion occarium TaxID=3059160 RepID=A0ABP1EBL8_9APHY